MMKKKNVCVRHKNKNTLRKIKPALLTLAIAQALSLQATQAASIEVTSDLDDGSDCTLRDALATTNAGTDQFNGCVLTGDALGNNDTITFGPAVAGQTITLTQGGLGISNRVSINPGGINTTTVDGNQASPVISISNGSGTPVVMNQLSITGSTGYAIYMRENNLTLSNSTVSGTAGIHVFLGGLALISNTVSDNTGTGIYMYGGNVSLLDSTVSGNTSHGIGLAQSEAELTNSTVSGNTGHGIYLNGGEVRLNNSTVTDNIGHGIYGYNWDIDLANSIVADNDGPGDPSVADCNVNYSELINAGTDTISTTVCGGATVADPLLGPLADYGGTTQTHALLAGSPAIDNATAAGATVNDQRGVASVGVRDSGAYEFDDVDPNPDSDSDGILDEYDNCPLDSNPIRLIMTLI